MEIHARLLHGQRLCGEQRVHGEAAGGKPGHGGRGFLPCLPKLCALLQAALLNHGAHGGNLVFGVVPPGEHLGVHFLNFRVVLMRQLQGADFGFRLFLLFSIGGENLVQQQRKEQTAQQAGVGEDEGSSRLLHDQMYDKKLFHHEDVNSI